MNNSPDVKWRLLGGCGLVCSGPGFDRLLLCPLLPSWYSSSSSMSSMGLLVRLVITVYLCHVCSSALVLCYWLWLAQYWLTVGTAAAAVLYTDVQSAGLATILVLYRCTQYQYCTLYRCTLYQYCTDVQIVIIFKFKFWQPCLAFFLSSYPEYSYSSADINVYHARCPLLVWTQ